MATTKKAADATETKTMDAATKPAEKKTTAKKPAAKTAAAKKPAAKKPAAAAEKKPAAKKTTAKKAETVGETAAAPVKKAAPAKKAAAKKTGIEVKLVKGLAGCKKDQIATAWSMGLKRIGDATIQPDNAATKGKIKKIIHLLKVTDAK